ncbi:hypothetical protein Hanom_Chr03g00245721 [Helianthus anomalus]
MVSNQRYLGTNDQINIIQQFFQCHFRFFCSWSRLVFLLSLIGNRLIFISVVIVV